MFNDINVLECVSVKDFENRSIFDDVMTKTWWHTFLTHGVVLTESRHLKLIL